MGSIVIPLEVLGACVGLLVAFVAAVSIRRWLLGRRGGSFDCSWRSRTSRAARLGAGWTLGVCQYQSDRLDWYRVFGLSWRPSRTLSRTSLELVESRQPGGAEAFALMPGSLVVRARHGGQTIELAMPERAFTALTSWLESAPPGQNVNNVA